MPIFGIDSSQIIVLDFPVAQPIGWGRVNILHVQSTHFLLTKYCCGRDVKNWECEKKLFEERNLEIFFEPEHCETCPLINLQGATYSRNYSNQITFNCVHAYRRVKLINDNMSPTFPRSTKKYQLCINEHSSSPIRIQNLSSNPLPL